MNVLKTKKINDDDLRYELGKYNETPLDLHCSEE